MFKSSHSLGELSFSRFEVFVRHLLQFVSFAMARKQVGNSAEFARERIGMDGAGCAVCIAAGGERPGRL